MHIDQFIEQYTQGEVEKVERKDPLARFVNKLTIQNIAHNLADRAVIRSPERSPERSGSPTKMNGSPKKQLRGSPKNRNL